MFADNLPGHTVSTTQAMGWAGVENGELMQLAADDGFDALLRLDKNIEFQQNLSSLPLSVLLVRAPSNRIEDLEPLAPASSSTPAIATSRGTCMFSATMQRRSSGSSPSAWLATGGSRRGKLEGSRL